MKQFTILATIVFLLTIGGSARALGRQSLFFEIGGADQGIGPVYELMAVSRAPVGVGRSVGRPLLQQRWQGRAFSPVSVRSGMRFMPGDTLWQRLRQQFEIRFAPSVMGSVYGLRKQIDSYTVSGTSFPVAYSLPMRWHAQLGLQADLSKHGAAFGLRLAVGLGLRSLHYDWSIAGINPNTNEAFGRYVQIESVQMVLHASPRLRFCTAGQRPWVFQAGLDAGLVRTIVNHSFQRIIPTFLDYDQPIGIGYHAAPILLVSKRFSLGNHFLEPTLQGTWSLLGTRSFPAFKTWSVGAGAALWLGKAPQ